MNTNKPVLKGFIRLAALALFVLSAQHAAAGYFFFHASKNLPSALPEAIPFLRQAAARAGGHPHYQLELGKALLEQYKTAPEDSLLSEALESFQSVTEKLPLLGKAWLLRAQTEIALRHREQERVPEAEWEKIRLMMERAGQLEPGNAWIFYARGAETLRERGRHPEDSQAGLDDLRRAAGMLPQAYLEPALAFLWEHFRREGLLIHVTPRHYEGYAILRNYAHKNRLWHLAEKIAPDFLFLRKQKYQELVATGTKFLERGDARGAYRFFQEAYWTEQSAPAAKAGLLISGHRAGKKAGAKDTGMLKEVLEQAGELRRFETLFEDLFPLVREAQDPALKERYEQASSVSAGNGPCIGRYPKPSWQGAGFKDSLLDRNGKIGTVVDLPSGKITIHLWIRAESGEDRREFGFIHVRLGQELIGSLYAGHFSWRRRSFRAETSGGKRWLNAELMNADGSSGAAAKGPKVRLGGIVIVSEEDFCRPPEGSAHGL